MKKYLFLYLFLFASVASINAQIDINQLKRLSGLVADPTKGHVPFLKGATSYAIYAPFDSLLTASNVLTNPSNYVSTSYSFAGDVTGTPTAMSVVKLRGFGVSATAPTSGQVLKYDGTNWTPSTDANNVYTQGTGISIASNVITNTGDTNASDDVTTSSSAGGDASGTFSALSVIKLRGTNIAAATPSTGDVLKLVSGTWTPTALPKTPRHVSVINVTTSGATLTISGVTASTDNDVWIWRNGVKQTAGAGNNWTRSGTTYTFSPPLVSQDIVEVIENVVQ
jgi:trimeric autotransporter adhesin